MLRHVCATVPCRQQVADAVKARYSQEQTELQLLLGWRSCPDCFLSFMFLLLLAVLKGVNLECSC